MVLFIVRTPGACRFYEESKSCSAKLHARTIVQLLHVPLALLLVSYPLQHV